MVGGNGAQLRWVIVDAEAITNMDFSAAQVVRELAADLNERGVTLVFARVQQPLKADLDRHDVTEVLGPEHIFVKLHDALRTWDAEQRGNN